MLALFREVIARSRAMPDVALSMCGDMAGNPIEAMVLIALGFRTLSMAATAIGPVKTMIRSLDAGAVADYLDEIGSRPDHSLQAQARSLRPRSRNRAMTVAADAASTAGSALWRPCPPAHSSANACPSRSSALSTSIKTAKPFLSGSRSFSGCTTRRQTSS